MPDYSDLLNRKPMSLSGVHTNRADDGRYLVADVAATIVRRLTNGREELWKLVVRDLRGWKPGGYR